MPKRNTKNKNKTLAEIRSEKKDDKMSLKARGRPRKNLLKDKLPKNRTKTASDSRKILMVATEASPYVAVGGVASVLGHLSKALKRKGHDVRIFIPKFGLMDQEKFKLKTVIEGLKVPTGDDNNPYLICNIKSCDSENGVITYFLENQEYFEKRANVYGYSDDPTRFALLSRGALEFIRTKLFVPDTVHCHDWHTGLIPNYLKTEYRKDPVLKDITTVFTIHNLAFQGVFDHKHVSELDYDDGKSHIASLFSQRINRQHFMRRGIIYSDAINTVSKNYSKEILTPEFGEGLDKLLLELKGKVFGIINGLDYSYFDPATDTLIEKNYDIQTLELRIENKTALQKEFGFIPNPNALVLGFVGRLDYMKGIDLMIKVLHQILKDYNIQFVQVGGGDWSLGEMLQELKNSYPDKVGVHPYPNFTLPRLIFAGSDCIIYPSRFEPCGIVQIEAMRYGSIPIVRKVGGLADTVEDFDSKTGKGTGLVFNDFDEFSLYGQIIRAHEMFKNKDLWTKLQKNAMKADYSWDYSAGEYEKLYTRANLLRTKRHPSERSIEEIIG